MAEKRTAALVKELTGFSGKAILYRLSPPMTWESWGEDNKPTEHTTTHVVVSAVFAPYTGPETYIFPADKDGKVIDWGELDGSYRGGLDHEAALSNAGYVSQ
ncbi:MAG TPA: hypothetical protein DCP69_04245 [Candidatus Omnitrophica bacterium]|nr:hypothetical protein [Candidatus Omnitrophota bacterium]